MELDWSTFLLEIVNVLVLVWLLKRFLFRPVMNVIEERKAAIAKTVTEANRLKQEAKTLQDRYEQRLTEWEKEREKVRAQLQEEIAAERQRRLAALQAEIDKARELNAAREGQQMKEMIRQAEATAVLHGTQFSAALLTRIASPELEARLIDAAIEDLSTLSRDRAETVKSTLPKNAKGRVTTAFPLDPPRRDRLVKQVEGVFDRRFDWEFVEERELLAGLEVNLGGWVLRGNLRDELKFFAEGGPSGC